MKTVRQFLKGLGITPAKVIFAYLFHGKIWGVAKLGCEAFSKLLKKVTPEKLVVYATWTSKFAQCLRYDITVLSTNEDAQGAGLSTVDAIEVFSTHLSDGDYSASELKDDISNVEQCIDSWKKFTKVDVGKK